MYRSKLCSQLCDAVGADILAFKVDYVLCVIAENAGRLIFAEYNIISVNIHTNIILAIRSNDWDIIR